MKPRSIGIIGGAGPLAGAFLLERVISLAMNMYGCYRDSDFPEIFLISFPFSEMLSPAIEKSKLQNELKHCFKQLRQSGATILALACNTLHAFLDEQEDLSDFISLPHVVAEAVPLSENPLVLCTSTSVQFGLHQQFFPCHYPDNLTQKQVDGMIDHILMGKDSQQMIESLKELIQAQTAKTIVLGCTELSLFSSELILNNKLIIDPLEIIANKIIETSFLNKRE
jgi:aspartate racemase